MYYKRICLNFIGPYTRWFGVVFGEEMILKSGSGSNDAAVFTIKKSLSPTYRNPALYSYELSARNDAGVVYTPNKDWNEISNIQNSTHAILDYCKYLNNTPWTITTREFIFRLAIGSSVEPRILQKEEFTSNAIKYDIISGKTTIFQVVLVKQIN